MGHGAYAKPFPHGSWGVRQTDSPWVMECTMVSRIFIFHGSWSVRQTISSWVMECATDCFSMGHGAYARLILHGSWGVRQADSPWVMGCTPD
jgi:hypothetical protein